MSDTREKILELLADGQPPECLMAQLGKAKATLDYHLQILNREFGARNYVHLAVLAVRANRSRISERLILKWQRQRKRAA